VLVHFPVTALPASAKRAHTTGALSDVVVHAIVAEEMLRLWHGAARDVRNLQFKMQPGEAESVSAERGTGVRKESKCEQFGSGKAVPYKTKLQHGSVHAGRIQQVPTNDVYIEPAC
jgi:hypothetical protein